MNENIREYFHKFIKTKPLHKFKLNNEEPGNMCLNIETSQLYPKQKQLNKLPDFFSSNRIIDKSVQNQRS